MQHGDGGRGGEEDCCSRSQSPGNVRICGNALDLPFRESSFDTVWGQDAWCYVTDKARLIREAARVTDPGILLAFTDWIRLRDVPDNAIDPLLGFMLFPYLETMKATLVT